MTLGFIRTRRRHKASGSSFQKATKGFVTFLQFAGLLPDQPRGQTETARHNDDNENLGAFTMREFVNGTGSAAHSFTR